MGLLDSLAKNALGGLLGGSSSNQDPASVLAELLGNAGGLEGLMSRFQQAGFGAQFESWVSTRENQTMDQNQLRSALGDDAIERLTGKIGGRAETLLPLLAQFLPQVIDKLTPSGRIDNNIPSGSQLQSVLTSLITSNLGSLLGKR